jgi:D-amino-acid dehydrogenase
MSHISATHGRADAVQTRDDTIACGVVVIAGGAWTPSLAASFGLRTGVRPVRGQIVHLQEPLDFVR